MALSRMHTSADGDVTKLLPNKPWATSPSHPAYGDVSS